MYLSIVIPVMNEELNIRPLLERVCASLAYLNDCDAEIIIIDDGSSDGTWSELQEMSKVEPRLKALRFSRNFGHQNALYAGLTVAIGDAVISLDGDLQHPPELIPGMVEEWRKGSQIVNTRRVDRETGANLKAITSAWFYKVFSWLAEVRLEPGSADFRLIDKKALNALLSCGDSFLFLRGAVQWIGFKITTIEYVPEKRIHGETKYSWSKMIAFAVSAVLSFSNRPLRVAIWLGVVTSGLAFAELLYILIQFAQGETVPGWASTMGVLVLLFGILFFLIGILGAYIGSIHQLAQQRPAYIVSEKTFGESSLD